MSCCGVARPGLLRACGQAWLAVVALDGAASSTELSKSLHTARVSEQRKSFEDKIKRMAETLLGMTSLPRLLIAR